MIGTFIQEEEAGFKNPIQLEDGWNWSFKDHVRRSFLYKNSQFSDNNGDRDKRPFKNIVRPVLNVQYRLEGFDVKDIELYVNNPENYYKSFLVDKFHEKWALENGMDTFIDDLVESYVDYGGVLVKNIDNVRPEVVDLRTIAFCDQTDILGGPFAIKHYFSPDQLREMQKKGWGETSNGATIGIEDLITKSETSKQQDKEGTKSETTGKYAEVYEVHGTFPEDYLRKDDSEDGKHTSQVHIIAFYKDNEDNKQSATLFSAREPELPFKYLARDGVQGRALGFGGIEELFEAQVWTNFAEIQIREMLELASKTFYKSNDARFKTRNNLSNAENGQVFDLQDGKDINQLDTQPRNLGAFNDSLDRWEEHGNKIGAAGEIFQGGEPVSGTPFASLQAQLIEGKSLHIWRQGRISVFVDEIYREWTLPHIKREVVKGQKFLTELSSDELQRVADSLSSNLINNWVKEQILSGELPNQEEVEIQRFKIQEDFLKGGSKKFLELLKGELKPDELDIRTNIAGKQKNLALLTDKMVNLVRQLIATPELRQDRGLTQILNGILESSGMSPITFSPQTQPVQPQGGGSTEPLKELATANERTTA